MFYERVFKYWEGFRDMASGADELKGMPIPRYNVALNFTDIQWMFGAINQAQSDQEVEKFENKFAETMGLNSAIYLNSAREALYLILKVLNLAPQSRVLIPDWTHHSVPGVIIAAGLQPCLVDVRRGTWVMGPELITDEDWEGVSVIIVTHMYGCPAPVQDLVAEAKKRNIFVIEDCSQGFGAKIGDKYVGSFGDAAIFSFSLTDNFTTMGGGMAVFKDNNYAQKAREMISQSKLTPNASIYPLILKSACMWLGGTSVGFMLGVYPYLAMGWSFLGKDLIHTIFSESISTTAPEMNRRPSPAQAALGKRLIDEALERNEKRNQYGIRLIELFEQENIPNLSFTQEPAYGTSIFTSFVINYEAKEKLARQLSSRGIDASPGYISKSIHSEPIFSENVRYYGILPNSNYLARTQLHLPIYSSLQDRDLVRMVKKCRESVEYIEHYEAGEAKYRSLPNADAPNLKNLPTPKKETEEAPEKKRPMSAAINNPKLRSVANPPRLSIPQRVKKQDSIEKNTPGE